MALARFILPVGSALVACAPATPPPATVPTTTPVPMVAAPISSQADQRLSPDAEFAPLFTDPERKKKLDASFAGIEAIVTAEMRAEDIPGVAIGVVVDGELAYAKGFGLADIASGRKPDLDTLFRVASISKAVTATTILRLRDDGKLSLDDPLTKWIPEAAEVGAVSSDSPPITLRHMLQHTSGLARDGAYGLAKVGESDIVAALRTSTAEQAPGVEFQYSNLGYAALGVVAGRAAGGSFRQAVSDLLLRPLGMVASTFAASEVSVERLATPYRRVGPGKWDTPDSKHYGDGAGELFSSVRDLARFAALHLSAYPPRSEPEAGPVRRSTLREAHEPRARGLPLRVWSNHEPRPGRRQAWGRAAGYGYGWFVKQVCAFDDVVMHGGLTPGYSSHVAMLREEGVAVVVLANAMHADTEWLSEEILGQMQKGGGLAKRTRDPRLAGRFAPSLRALSSLIAKWDDSVYRGMLRAGRPALASEEVEMAGYRALHGSCSSFTLGEVTSPTRGRFVFTCERGTLDMAVTLGNDGRVDGFSGTSRGVPADPAQTDAASRVAKLITAWDARLYDKHFAKHAPDKAKAQQHFSRIRNAHGVCTVKAFEREPSSSRFALSCERLGDLQVTVELDGKDSALVKSYDVSEASRGACPTF